jgi:hypothetical protein
MGRLRRERLRAVNRSCAPRTCWLTGVLRWLQFRRQSREGLTCARRERDRGRDSGLDAPQRPAIFIAALHHLVFQVTRGATLTPTPPLPGVAPA